MTDFNKFKRFTPNQNSIDQSGDDTPKNPYIKNKYEAKKSPPIDKNPPEKGPDMMHIASKFALMEKEIAALKRDIATLVTVLEDDYERKMSKKEARDIYFKFRANPSHLDNRLNGEE